MSESGHCGECQRPIRSVRVQWETGPKDFRIPLDYVKSPEGDYAVVGPESAVFIKFEDRAAFTGPRYTDHRRTCPMKAIALDPDRPAVAKITINCEPCQASAQSFTLVDDAKKTVEKFIDDHANCRGRKAS